MSSRERDELSDNLAGLDLERYAQQLHAEDPSANCDPSEAPTPVRERRRESPPPDEPENAEEESLRLALELQEREERYAREQEEGAARHAELSQRRREEASSDGEDDEGEDPRGNQRLRRLDGVELPRRRRDVITLLTA